MTEQEKTRNGLKLDSLEIRQETEKLNFNVAAFVVSWCLIEVYPSISVGFSGMLYDIVEMLYFGIAILITGAGVYYGLKSFMGIIKLDYLFAGQLIRDAESIASWITSSKSQSLVDNFLAKNYKLPFEKLHANYFDYYYNELTDNQRSSIMVDVLWQKVLKNYKRLEK